MAGRSGNGVGVVPTPPGENPVPRRLNTRPLSRQLVTSHQVEGKAPPSQAKGGQGGGRRPRGIAAVPHPGGRTEPAGQVSGGAGSTPPIPPFARGGKALDDRPVSSSRARAVFHHPR